MRTQEMIQHDLDAVARTFPNSRGSMLPMGMVHFARPRTAVADAIPMPVKRFDFLAKGGGDLSVEELVLLQKSSEQ